jgi:hypothetical protein
MKLFDLASLKRAFKEHPEYHDMLTDMADTTNHFFQSFQDGPEQLSRWGHHYFCPDDGGVLSYDEHDSKLHVCPICKKHYTETLYDQVWVTLTRNQAVINLWKSALLYRLTRKRCYLGHIETMISTYVRRYPEYPCHDKENRIFSSISSASWGCGKIMPQGLNEAIFIIRLLTALSLVKPMLTAEDRKDIQSFCVLATELLLPQIDRIHNIPIWISSALAVIGAFSDEPSLIETAFSGEYGLVRQLEKGLSDDGFWFEGSIHYHFFALEAILNAMIFAKSRKYPIDRKFATRVKKMLLMPKLYAFDNQILPNPNDGWPDINLKTYLHVYDMATRIYGTDSPVGHFARMIDASPTKRVGIPLSTPYYYENRISLERLTWTPHFTRGETRPQVGASTCLKASQCAILKNDHVNVFLKYGHNSPSHAHPDKMSLEATLNGILLTKDLSNAGYGTRICNEWHRTTLAHSTVTVNGQNQLSYRPGKCRYFRDDYVKAEARDIYRETENQIGIWKRLVATDEIIADLIKKQGCSREEAETMLATGSENLHDRPSKEDPNPIVDVIRTVKLLPMGFIDCFQVTTSPEATIDYVFHTEATLITKPKTMPGDRLYADSGYSHLKSFDKVVTRNKKITLFWELGGMRIQSQIKLPGKMSLYLMKTLSNPADHTRDSFLVRVRGSNATYTVRWEIVKED